MAAVWEKQRHPLWDCGPQRAPGPATSHLQMGKLSVPRETCELPRRAPGLKNIGLHRTSLVIQWLGLHTSNAGGTGSIPGQGTKNHTSSVVQRKRKDRAREKTKGLCE